MRPALEVVGPGALPAPVWRLPFSTGPTEQPFDFFLLTEVAPSYHSPGYPFEIPREFLGGAGNSPAPTDGVGPERRFIA